MTQVRETVRECGCDPWIVQCAHVGDRHVALFAFFRLWHVCDGTVATAEDACGPWLHDFKSALAAFAKAEQELLRADE